MDVVYSESDWNFDVKTDISRDHIPSSFNGLPIPERRVEEEIGLEVINEVDAIIKKIQVILEATYGKARNEEIFPYPVLEFYHKENKNLELLCYSDSSLNERSRIDKKKFGAYKERWHTPGNYQIIFSQRVQKLLEDGEKIL